MYRVFEPLAWKKYFLQHTENCVNTSFYWVLAHKHIVNTVIFATRGKNIVYKYRGFGLPTRQKHRLRCFLLRELQKHLRIFGHYGTKKRGAGAATTTPRPTPRPTPTYTPLHYITPHYTTPHHTTLHYTTILYYTVLYYTILYYITIVY